MAVHNINEVSPEEKIQAYQILVKRLLQQAAVTQRRYDFWKASLETGQPPEVIAAQQDAVLAEWYRLEKLEDSCAPFFAQGFPRPAYERPDFLADVKRLSEDPWEVWQRDAKLPTEDSTDDTDIAAYRPAKQRLLDAATRANWDYSQWRASAEIGADPTQTAELQAAALRSWHQLELCEYDFKKFIEAGFPPCVYPRPDFTGEVKQTSDPWTAWSEGINLRERVNHDPHPDQRKGFA